LNKLTITALLLALALASCSAPEAHPEPADVGGGEVVGVEVTPVEIDVEQGEIEEEPEESGEPEEEIPQPVEDTFEYKEIIFSGWFSHGIFFGMNMDSFYSKAHPLSSVSFDAALAFITGDVERLLEHFDDNIYADEQIGRMMNIHSYDLNDLKYLAVHNINYDIRENDDGYFLINYVYSFNFMDKTDLLRVDAYMNDNNEWKIKYINWNIG